MDRRSFIKRFSIGVLACGMLREALLDPLTRSTVPIQEVNSLHYVHIEYGLGFQVSREMLEDNTMYGSRELHRQMAQELFHANQTNQPN